MSRKCDICGKGVVFGHNVSHSNRKSPKKWRPNLHNATFIINGKKTRIRACTSCIQKGKVRTK